jgi:hypothetical protein
MKNTLDADREEWDIIDDGSDPFAEDSRAIATPRVIARGQADSDEEDLKPASRKSTGIDRKRKRLDSIGAPCSSSSDVSAGLPRLIARDADDNMYYVRLTGTGLFDSNYEYPLKRKRGRPVSIGRRLSLESLESKTRATGKKPKGRPKGSTNKPKTLVGSPARDSSTPLLNGISLTSVKRSPGRPPKKPQSEVNAATYATNLTDVKKPVLDRDVDARSSPSLEPPTKRVRLSSPLVRGSQLISSPILRSSRSATEKENLELPPVLGIPASPRSSGRSRKKLSEQLSQKPTTRISGISSSDLDDVDHGATWQTSELIDSRLRRSKSEPPPRKLRGAARRSIQERMSPLSTQSTRRSQRKTDSS